MPVAYVPPLMQDTTFRSHTVKVILIDILFILILHHSLMYNNCLSSCGHYIALNNIVSTRGLKVSSEQGQGNNKQMFVVNNNCVSLHYRKTFSKA
jgi:hypothetical protein